MTDRPVIFSAPMILALLREANEPGTGKSQTRRLARRHKVVCDPKNGHFLRNEYPASPWQRVKPGDRLWCRESLTAAGDGIWKYAADGGRLGLGGPSYQRAVAWANKESRGGVPSIHMPRWASRLTLLVTGTKIERLRDISEQDCEREGIRWDPEAELWHVQLPSGQIVPGDTAQNCFRMLWVALNGRLAWVENPEVVAVSFRVHLANVDAMKEAA